MPDREKDVLVGLQARRQRVSAVRNRVGAGNGCSLDPAPMPNPGCD